MISLDAATVLAQWAIGGMAFCWFTTRRREVGLGYGWLLRGTYLLMALGAVAAGAAVGFDPVRDLASVAVAVAALDAHFAQTRRDLVDHVLYPASPGPAAADASGP